MLSKLIKQKKFMQTLCYSITVRSSSSDVKAQSRASTLLHGKEYKHDSWTNVTPAILEKVSSNLHRQPNHPIGLMKTRIQNYFYRNFVKRGNPIFSVFDDLNPVVSLSQNFDNLLVPKDHVSRSKSDSYYLNCDYMLRAHTTAHQKDLIISGLNSFLMVGDVYRRDTVDRSHYPVFHQLDGVRLFSKHELFDGYQNQEKLSLFDDSPLTELNQAGHALEATLFVQTDLKTVLENLALELFGKDTETRWVEAEFPFTHPSWELEIMFQDKWLEVLGCGVIRQEILNTSGAGDKIGWAFGMGLERLAMKLYSIPDIRIFWSTDPRFTAQFNIQDPNTPIVFQPLSKQPAVYMDISFFISSDFSENDLYDIIRTHGGNLIEDVELIDSFTSSKLNKTSHCYRITYRPTDRVLTKEEVNVIHKNIADDAAKQLNVEIR